MSEQRAKQGAPSSADALTQPLDATGPLTRFGLGPLTPEQRDIEVQAGVLGAVLKQVPASVLGSVSGAAILAAALWSRVPSEWMGLWLAAIFFEAILRLRLARVYAAADDRVSFVRAWGRRWTWQAALAGVLWGVAGAAFFPSGDPALQLVVVVLVLGVAFGSLTLFAAWRPAFHAYMFPALVPLPIRMAWEADANYLVAAAAMAGVFAFSLFFGRRFGEAVREAVKTNHENELLVEQLLTEKRAADGARKAAEAATRSRSQFFAAASHDLRQPLQAIGIYVSLLRKRAEGPVVSLITNLSSAVDSLSKLVEELLEISRLDSGAIEPKIDAVPIDELFNTLEQEFSPIAASKGLVLRVRRSRRSLQTDSLLMQRVLRNLLANAIRYTSQGGVLLAARVRPGGKVMLEVWDTGAGIASHEVERIFEEFYRGESSRAENSGAGFGLGLSIVRRICRLLDVPLAIATRPGRGTMFRLVVPASSAPRRQGRGAPDTLSWLLRPLTGHTIALVEDNAEILNSLTRLLRSWGAEVVAGNGFNAALIRSLSMHEKVDAIVADQNLGPHSVNGVETIFRIREILGAPVPAVVLTAVAAAEVQSQFQRVMRERIALNPTQAHAIARSRTEEPLVLQKPTTPAVLNNAIAVQLGLANLHPQEAGRP